MTDLSTVLGEKELVFMNFNGTWTPDPDGVGGRVEIRPAGNGFFTVKGNADERFGYACLTPRGNLFEIWKSASSGEVGYRKWKMLSSSIVQYEVFELNGKNLGSGRFFRQS